jgi:hypothetical protein
MYAGKIEPSCGELSGRSYMLVVPATGKANVLLGTRVARALYADIAAAV